MLVNDGQHNNCIRQIGVEYPYLIGRDPSSPVAAMKTRPLPPASLYMYTPIHGPRRQLGGFKGRVKSEENIKRIFINLYKYEYWICEERGYMLSAINHF